MGGRPRRRGAGAHDPGRGIPRAPDRSLLVNIPAGTRTVQRRLGAAGRHARMARPVADGAVPVAAAVRHQHAAAPGDATGMAVLALRTAAPGLPRGQHRHARRHRRPPLPLLEGSGRATTGVPDGVTGLRPLAALFHRPRLDRRVPGSAVRTAVCAEPVRRRTLRPNRRHAALAVEAPGRPGAGRQRAGVRDHGRAVPAEPVHRLACGPHARDGDRAPQRHRTSGPRPLSLASPRPPARHQCRGPRPYRRLQGLHHPAHRGARQPALVDPAQRPGGHHRGVRQLRCGAAGEGRAIPPAPLRPGDPGHEPVDRDPGLAVPDRHLPHGRGPLSGP
jgi:hypothetical protein